ncbi:MAG: hypothetical protein ACI9SP_002000 [Arenicella sp.]|jgi:hypothetical protein
MIESKVVIAIISALIGSALGFLAKSHFLKLSLKHKLTDTIINRYLDIRDEISKIVSDCAVGPNVMDESWRHSKINELGRAYYQFFDYVPHEIIRELTCLQFCLKVEGDYLYKSQGNNLTRVKQEDLEEFCYAISSFGNYSHAIYFNLMFSKDSDKRNFRVEYQARHVLMMINRFFTEENLSNIEFLKPKNYSDINSFIK